MSEQHVFAVASGFGLRVVPARGPFRFRRANESLDLDVECQHADGWRFGRITPDRGEFVFRLGEHTGALADVAAVEAGPDWDAWWVETTRYRLPLPAIWTLHSSGNRTDASVFDLLGPKDASIFVQTPRRMPSLESLQGPGQQFRDTGQLERAAWLEFDYSHDGRPWIQRHELLHRGMLPIVVTLQAPAESVPACIPTLADVVERIQPSKHPG